MVKTSLRPPSELLNPVVLGDGFGQMLIDCQAAGARPGTHRQVIERVDGYVSVEDAYRYFSPQVEWVEAEKVALEQARGRVLDVGCAAGRHMLEAQARGLETVGIDPSPGAVYVARSYGLDVRQGTVLQPGPDLGTFDTLLLLGGNLGLLGSQARAPSVLASLAALARPGAQILANGHDSYTVQDPDHVAFHQANTDAGQLPGQVLMRVRYGRMTSEWFDRLLLSPTELQRLVADSPWRLESCTDPGPTGFYLAHLVLHQRPSTASAMTM